MAAARDGRAAAVDLGADVKKALTAGGISTEEGPWFPRLIVGSDNRLRLSLNSDGNAGEVDRHKLANCIVRTLHAANFKVSWPEMPNEHDVAGPLARGAALFCERAPD